jgi:hypothetical protein
MIFWNPFKKFQKENNMKPTNNYGLSDSLIDAVRKAVEEALVGGQKKLDVDKDGKLEKTDFASLRAKKDAVDTKPKLKEDHPDEKEDKALIKKLIKKADVSDNEEDKALIKKTMKKEEVDQMDEAVKNFDVEPKRAWKIVHHLNGVGIRTKTEANDDRGSVNIKATHKDPAHLAIHISRAVDAHAQDHALSARMRGQLRASGVEPKPMKKEEYEQMDEVKLADLPRRMVKGTSYGANYVDPEGADDADDMKKAEPKRKSGPQGTMKRRFIKDKSKLRMQYK